MSASTASTTPNRMPMSRRARSFWLGSRTSPPLITRSNLSCGPIAARTARPTRPEAASAETAPAPARKRRRAEPFMFSSLGCFAAGAIPPSAARPLGYSTSSGARWRYTHATMGQEQSTAGVLLDAARELSRVLAQLEFPPPITHVYNPHEYAWVPYEAYVSRFGAGPKRVVLLGMNPGPFGMMQTGVPFGEIPAVRDWMRIVAPVGKPKHVHPRRPIEGFACKRSEVDRKSTR